MNETVFDKNKKCIIIFKLWEEKNNAMVGIPDPECWESSLQMDVL